MTNNRALARWWRMGIRRTEGQQSRHPLKSHIVVQGFVVEDVVAKLNGKGIEAEELHWLDLIGWPLVIDERPACVEARAGR